jgi:type II secretory pathway component GspD/PulD (secretin)
MQKYILAALLVTFVRPGFGQCLHPAASPASPYPLKQTEQNAHNGNQIILVKLQMIEVSLTKLASVSSERYGGSKGMSALELLTKLESTGGVDRSSAPDLGKLAGLIEALPKDSLAKPLAAPSLMVEPKKPAYCLVGGEIGYRVKDAAGKESVEYKEYGTRADVVAIPTAGDQIHLDVRLRVSELDPAHSIPARENSVPAITCRETEGGLALRSGETVVLGGLIEVRDEVVNQSTGEGKSKIVHVANRVESFVLVQATLVSNEKTGAEKKKAGSSSASRDGASRR